MDISRKPSHRAKSRSKAHILRAEPAVTADAVAVPANLPGARNGALDIGDNPQRHAGEILRLQGLAEPQILHRSEEHTAEIQPLMRNSHAGCCLKNKKQH